MRSPIPLPAQAPQKSEIGTTPDKVTPHGHITIYIIRKNVKK